MALSVTRNEAGSTEGGGATPPFRRTPEGLLAVLSLLFPLFSTRRRSHMSLTNDCLRTFAAGAVICCAVYRGFAADGEAHVGIDNFIFNPATLTVPVGTRVEWANEDDIPHTVVEATGTFKSPALDTQDKFSFTFSQAGTFNYFCSLHPQMTGKVVVTP
jgi:plastocyanin